MTNERITARELDAEFDRWWSEKKEGQWSGAEACKGFPVDLAHHIWREAWMRAQAWEKWFRAQAWVEREKNES